ncbi:hypothetical protein ACFLSA_07165, partial [Bacteroidota bacterium]
MKRLISKIAILVLTSVVTFGQTEYSEKAEFEKNPGYRSGMSDTNVLYKTTFKDINWDYKKTINGAIETSYIDLEGTLLDEGIAARMNITFKKGKDWAIIHNSRLKPGADIGYLYRYVDYKDIVCQGEMHHIIKRNWDTVWIDGTWKAESGIYEAKIGIFTFQESVNDTSYYHSEKLGNFPKHWQYNQSLNHDNVNRNYGIVSKTGGMLWRHDNWVGGDIASTNSMGALAHWLSVLDKYGYKGTLALNERTEELWDGKYEIYKKFWQSIQARGHEIADHGPDHKNFWYPVSPEHRVVTENTPGVNRIKKGRNFDIVIVDTVIGGFVSTAGFDIMLNRSQRLFKYIGLNPFTYWIEGGGVGAFYSPDSLYFGSYKNRCVGGGEYTNQKYKHMGFNTPWVGKSEYFMDWRAYESISLQTRGDAVGERNYSAKDAIKKLADQSAKHTLTVFRQHVQYIKPDSWYLSCMDSILFFAFKNQAFIRSFTGTEASKIVYQSQINPYMNYIPCNPITSQVFEDNIDSKYGDTEPDGWELGPNATYWQNKGGSQGSASCVIIGTGEDKNLKCTRLYGIEKGINTFSIDIKDRGSNDTVYVKIIYYSGNDYFSLKGTEVDLAFPSGDNWLKNTAEITFPYNTSYIDIKVWSRKK